MAEQYNCTDQTAEVLEAIGFAWEYPGFWMVSLEDGTALVIDPEPQQGNLEDASEITVSVQTEDGDPVAGFTFYGHQHEGGALAALLESLEVMRPYGRD